MIGLEPRRRTRIGQLLLLLLVSGSWAPAFSARSGAEILAEIEKRFGSYKTFSAKFEKQFYWAILDEKHTRKGRIYTRQPNQFRVETDDGNMVLADGETIWAFVKQNEQIIASSYDGELRTPWGILLAYTANYLPVQVEELKYEGRPAFAVSLRPRSQNSSISQLKIWVSKKDWFLLKVEQTETNDDVTTYLLKEHKTNKRLDEKLFAFDPPENVELIDQRRSASPDR